VLPECDAEEPCGATKVLPEGNTEGLAAKVLMGGNTDGPCGAVKLLS